MFLISNISSVSDSKKIVCKNMQRLFAEAVQNDLQSSTLKKVNLTHKHVVKLLNEEKNELLPSESFIGLKSAELSSIFISSLSVN